MHWGLGKGPCLMRTGSSANCHVKGCQCITFKERVICWEFWQSLETWITAFNTIYFLTLSCLKRMGHR